MNIVIRLHKLIHPILYILHRIYFFFTTQPIPLASESKGIVQKKALLIKHLADFLEVRALTTHWSWTKNFIQNLDLVPKIHSIQSDFSYLVIYVYEYYNFKIMKWCAIVMKSPTGISMWNYEEVRLDPFYKETDFDFELEFIQSSTIQRKFIKPIVSFHLIWFWQQINNELFWKCFLVLYQKKAYSTC